MSEILQYDFMRHALMVGLLVSIACGVVGTYVVVKRIVFINWEYLILLMGSWQDIC